MKNIFDILAKYNELTNQEMIKILETIDSEKLTKDLGSYYGSILGILNHHLMADIGWLRALGNNVPSLDFLPPLLNRFPSSRLPPKKLYWASLKDYKQIRTEIDDLLKRVVQRLSESEYNSILKITGRRGEQEYITWRILLHLFNHHTHHRGGVSLLLDQLGIENDYSNMLWKV
ncbi:MAG: DinB family protein [Promethearchaeota archaeon]